MPITSLLVAYLCLASLSLSGLALLLSRYERHSPEPQKMAGITGYVGVVALALAVLVWTNLRVAVQTEIQPGRSPAGVQIPN